MATIFDRVVGIMGLLVSAAGLFASPEYPAGWAAVVAGATMVAWAVYAIRRDPLRRQFSMYEYDFRSGDKSRVRGRKIIVFKILKPNVTRLESGLLTASGYYEDFTSNIGRIHVQHGEGGQTNVICDVEEALPVGEYVEWVLGFDIVDSFDDQKEDVTLTAHTPGKIGALYVKFSSESPPKSVWKSVSDVGRNPMKTPVRVNEERPEVFWRFKIERNKYYTIGWEWPEPGLEARRMSENETLQGRTLTEDHDTEI